MPGGLFCAIGHPLNDGTWTYTWQNGRQLACMKSVDTDAQFIYNENGLRVQKTVNGVVTQYTLHGKNIVHMTHGSNDLHFFYDAQNRPAVVVFNGTPYSYVKNLQGDIVAILDSDGSAVVQYKYDAWGRQIGCDVEAGNSNAAALSTLNPFRYRGYVYDEETGLYYLRSRYFSPALCRFCNSDNRISPSHASLVGNLYTYCVNCPIDCTDYDGYAPDRGTRTEIHNMVCKAVKEQLDGQIRFGMKVVISAASFGYMNIVHNGDKVIEVKRLTVNVQLACAQLLSYISGTWVGSLRVPASMEHVTPSDTEIYGHFVYGEYVVVYAGIGNGFVLYDYYSGMEDLEKIDDILEKLRKKKKEYDQELDKNLTSSGGSSHSSALAAGGAMFVCAIAFGFESTILQKRWGW